MNEFDKISEDLFNKIRGRFPNVTIGDAAGNVTNQPEVARFFDFDYNGLGNVSVSIDEDDGLTIIYSKEFISNEDTLAKQDWYSFLKELRYFAKKRMLDYSVRDITKSNLQKRDYRFLAKTSGEEKMTESKLYGTSRISYQKVGEARIVIKHTEGINQESATGRTQKIGKIYIESADGERFRYPFKHLSGARAMARHVAEGGNTYDDFGKHIVGLSEEMAKLRKFKNYMGRSAVMAESLAEYNDAVKERIATVKKTIASLQKPAYYAEAFASFETPMMEDVPEDVKENWIDELTIKQFNEELADVFPYIYKLVSEATKAQELGPDDLDESGLMAYAGKKKHGAEYMKKAAQAGRDGASQEELGALKDKYSKAAKNKKTKEEIELEQGFEEMMGQFGEDANPFMSMIAKFEDDMDKEMGYYGSVDAAKVGMLLKQGKIEDAAGEMADAMADQDGGSDKFDIVMQTAQDYIEDYMAANQSETEQRTDEFLPALAIPALITAARVAAPKLIQLGAKILTKGAQGAGAVAKGAGKVATKNPGTTAAVGGGAYVGKKAGDAIDAVGDMAGDLATSASDLIAKAEGGVEAIQGEISAFLGGDAVKQVAAMASKYALPALAVVALLYGGKKVIDMLKSKDDDNMQTASMEEDDLEEAYINTSKDAVEVLGALRGKGKAIERGQDDDQGNLANQYVSDVWDVYSFIEARTNGFSGLDKNAKAAIEGMMKLRGEAKKLETKPGSGKNARFGNAIVNTLYPVIEYLYTTDFDRNKKEDDTDEGNAYAHAVKKAKMDGKKKGDKVKGPDGDEITLEKDQKTPLGEFILSYFDREAGQFPKGETAVLTMVEKDYGEQFIEPAKAFIEKINNKVAEMYGYKEAEQDTEYLRMRELAGL